MVQQTEVMEVTALEMDRACFFLKYPVMRLVYTKYPSKRQDDCHHIRQPKKIEPATATRWNREIT